MEVMREPFCKGVARASIRQDLVEVEVLQLSKLLQLVNGTKDWAAVRKIYARA